MLVKGINIQITYKESKLLIKDSLSKMKIIFTVILFVVKGFKIWTKNFTNLLEEADKLVWNGEQLFTIALCTLHEPYIIPGLLPTGFNDFLVFSDILFFLDFWERYQWVIIWLSVGYIKKLLKDGLKSFAWNVGKLKI